MLLNEFLSEWNNSSDKVLVRTSGSTGNPKPMWVEKRRMEASARLTCDFLGLSAGDTALLCMPLDYIAGKMVVVRSIVRNMRLISVKPSARPFSTLSGPVDFAAVTPMQVYNTIKYPRERDIMAGTRHLIIGGGAIDNVLEEAIRSLPNPVWSTYGMTETLSHIALRRLNGPAADSWYTPFEGITTVIGDDGCLVINAPMLNPDVLYTNDLAEMHPDGRRFRILGRKDNVIDSGGIKIRIEDVEKALSGHLAFPYMITKTKDACYGEIVVLLIAGNDVSAAKSVCESVLPHYWRPKAYLSVTRIPMTATGKLARAEGMRIAEKRLMGTDTCAKQ